MPSITWIARDELGRLIDVTADTLTNVAPPGPEEISVGGDAGVVGTLAEVLVAGNDTGGVEIAHFPAVNVFAVAALTATATGTGDAWTQPLATVVDGNATAAPRAVATGTGNTDACTYARSVDGAALADNDAAATGTGVADAGMYAAAVNGTANAAGFATTTGTGVATVGGTATGTGGTAGVIAVADAVSGRLGFNGATPIVKPTVTGSRGGNAALASLLTELANLGLITDSSS